MDLKYLLSREVQALVSLERGEHGSPSLYESHLANQA